MWAGCAAGGVAQEQSRLGTAKHLVYFGQLFGAGGCCELLAGEECPLHPPQGLHGGGLGSWLVRGLRARDAPYL